MERKQGEARGKQTVCADFQYLFEKRDMIRLDSNFERDFIDIIENENILVMIKMQLDYKGICSRCLSGQQDNK